MTKLDFTIIVAGMPRTGTSMTMQMLEAGGAPIPEHRRVIGRGNPYGFYEVHRKVVQSMKGYAVKCLGPRFSLDIFGEVKIILPVRSPEEILASRAEIQGGRFGVDKSLVLQRIISQFAEINKFLEESKLPVLRVPYNDYFLKTREVVTNMRDFLGDWFDADAALMVVDKSLYKVRANG